MYEDIIKSKNKELESATKHFSEEVAKIRTGRANASMIENILVDYYGTKTPLNQVANITVPEPRVLLIQPWSVDSLSNIEAAIKMSDLNLTPNNDGEVIRINIPQLNEERRKELVKVLNGKAEDARIAVRNIREDIWQEIQKAEKEGKIAEDDKFRGKEKLQEVIDEYNDRIEEFRAKKEKEILTI